jgi:hypothetical protein
MTSSYRILPAADTDLDDQAAYLACEASLDVALRFYDAAAATFEAIARMPVSASGDRRPINAWKACGSGVSMDSKGTSSSTELSRMASRLCASCTGHGISTGCWNRKPDLSSPARPV